MSNIWAIMQIRRLSSLNLHDLSRVEPAPSPDGLMMTAVGVCAIRLFSPDWPNLMRIESFAWASWLDYYRHEALRNCRLPLLQGKFWISPFRL
jgi:hypothetical protein